MNLSKMKEIEDLKLQLEDMEEDSRSTFEKKVIPAIREKNSEFINSFIKYFEANGFIVEKNLPIVTATYNTLQITLLAENNRTLIINQGNTELAKVFIEVVGTNKSGSYSLPGDPFEAEKVRIKKRMEGISKDIESYENPTIKFTNLTTRKAYNNANELLDGIFK